MFTRRRLAAAVLIAFCAIAGETESAAALAAQKWLALVDAAKHGDSWDRASESFRKGITRERWVEAVTNVREQVGKFETRTLTLTQPLKDPPNAPPGDYLLLQYTSNFSRKNGAIETIILRLDRDKQWRTSGYFVK